MAEGTHGPFVVGIGGSTNPHSITSALLHTALGFVAERGAQTVAFTGAALTSLPMYAAPEHDLDPSAAPIVEAVRRADAIVLSTPGYHGAMSGAVKNAIDHLEALREDVRPYLDGRAVGIIVAAAGWQACGTTLMSARSAVHALRGWPTPMGVTVNSAEQAPGADGRFEDRVTGALRILAGQVMDFVSWRTQG